MSELAALELEHRLALRESEIEKLKAENQKFQDELFLANEKLASNVCGYCWDKMHESEFEKLEKRKR